MPEQNKDRDHEMDEFWDIARLLPTEPRQARSAPPRPTPTAIEIELGSTPSASSRTETAPVRDEPIHARTTPSGQGEAAADLLGKAHYVPPHTAKEAEPHTPEFAYEPDNLLLHRVEVYAWRSDYRYFDRFLQDAARIDTLPVPTERPHRESFFSYFPQYAQLGRRQTNWYLWWRDRVQHGVFPDTDYAYILLYIFELLNRPMPPQSEEPNAATATADQLAHVWMAYRARHPQLDHYLCEWLCDFCLVHHVAAPVDILAPALDDIVSISKMKEFYLSAAMGDGGKGTEGARILLRYGCQYDYHKSKFANGEHAALFDRIIPDAIAHALPLLLGGEGRPPMITMQDLTVTRDIYTGALCAYQNKRRVVVSYTSFSRSHDLRFLMGDMVKHVENRLRKYIGVRSRLSVVALPSPIRSALDAYLDPRLPEASATPPPKKRPPRPDYEALYDLPVKPVSSEAAARIEQTSWETTRILTEAFDGEATPEVAPSPIEAIPPVPDPPVSVAGPELDPELAAFLRLALVGDAIGQRELAGRLHTLPDALADRINEWAVGSEIGDVVLEDIGNGYAVIEDYVADIETLLSSASKE